MCINAIALLTDIKRTEQVNGDELLAAILHALNCHV